MSARAIYAAGWRQLVCVTTPDAKLSDRSRIDAASRGKAPGRPNQAGNWAGYPWIGKTPTPAEVELWDSWGANVGVQAGYYPGIDLDVEDPDTGALVSGFLEHTLGATIARQGRAGRNLLIYRLDKPGTFRRQRLRFELGGRSHLVEILGEGQQYVVHGTHPSGLPYYTDPSLELVGPETVPEVSARGLQDALDGLVEYLELMGASISARGTENAAGPVPNQGHLRAPVDLVREAVELIPNNRKTFPFWEDYLRMGYAIRGATQGDQEAGFDIFWRWCERWEDGVADLDTTRADWSKLRPPFRIGAGYLFSLARPHGFNDSELVFGPGDPEAPSVPADPKSPAPIEYSDAAMAGRFVSRFQDLVRHAPPMGWMVWNDAAWVRDDTAQVRDLAANLLREASGEALLQITPVSKAEAVSTKLASTSMRNAVVEYAGTHRAIVARPEDFDADPWILNTPAGTVDLRTGDVRQHRRGDLVSLVTAVSPQTGSPTRWLQFLEEATLGDRELIDYLQRLAGYALTGSVEEHCLAFFHGGGGNGKGVFLGALLGAMGTYARIAPMDAFTASFGDRHPTDIAMLRGARLVTAQETQEGRSWDEARVKSLTGGDPVSARFMRQDFFTFTPRFKLVFAGNHKPRIRSLDDAWRRRFHLVPFVNKPAVIDRLLSERLKDEWGQILQWAMEGCVAWQEEGLQPPTVVLSSTNEYFEDSDPIGRWLSRDCRQAEEVCTLSQDLYDSWRDFCADMGEHPTSQRKLSQALQERGFPRFQHPQSRRQGFRGIEVLPREIPNPFPQSLKSA